MDIFTQKKFLVITIIVLAVLNITLMGFFLIRGNSNRPEQSNNSFSKDKITDLSDVLKKELALSAEQVERIKKIRSDFFEKEKELSKEIRGVRDSMNFIMFNKDTDEEIVKDLAKRVSEYEYKMELLRYEQAQQFKSICTPEQREKFEALVKEIRDYFKPNNQPPRKGDRPPRRDEKPIKRND